MTSKESLKYIFNLALNYTNRFSNQTGFRHNEAYDIIKQALQRLEAIDNVNPSEALECLNKIVESFNETTVGMYGLGEVVVANDLIYNFKEELDTIKQALIRAEKDQLLFKNIHNTKVKTPLVSIFNGLSKEERYKFTEHIYYNWEEMKEELESKNNELEKENIELKKKAIILDIIKEKNVDIEYIKTCFYDEKGGMKEYNSWVGHDEDRALTQEQFNLLKEVLENEL